MYTTLKMNSYTLHACICSKGSPGAAVKLLPCDHEVLQPHAEMQGKAAYIRPKVVGPFPIPCARESYMYRAALYMPVSVS
jgi:hypothetical protein